MNASTEFVLIYRPHPVEISCDRKGWGVQEILFSIFSQLTVLISILYYNALFRNLRIPQCQSLLGVNSEVVAEYVS